MKRKQKIAIIGTVGLPARYGGFETLAEHLVKNLDDEFDFTVYCSGKAYSRDERMPNFGGAKLKYLPFNANGIQSIVYDSLSILHAAIKSDVLLVLGVAGAWLLPIIKLLTNRKIIVSIDGIEWKRDKWNPLAKAYLFWAEKIAVKHSHIDISDNESIQDYTAMRYGSLSRVVEYGADHTTKVKPSGQDKLDFPFLKRPYAFKVCRIEPENNVHKVLEGFSQMPKRTLVVMGNWNRSEYGVSLRNRYAGFSNIIMLDPIYEQRKLDLIRGNALVYIHGHSAGGTNPSLVEAMSLGLPIIAYSVSYNKATTENKAVYFHEPKDLKENIERLSIHELKEMGVRMESIARRRYVWEQISNRYKDLIFESLQSKSKNKVVPALLSWEETKLLDLDLGHLKYQQVFYEKR